MLWRLLVETSSVKFKVTIPSSIDTFTIIDKVYIFAQSKKNIYISKQTLELQRHEICQGFQYLPACVWK